MSTPLRLSRFIDRSAADVGWIDPSDTEYGHTSIDDGLASELLKNSIALMIRGMVAHFIQGLELHSYFWENMTDHTSRPSSSLEDRELDSDHQG